MQFSSVAKLTSEENTGGGRSYVSSFATFMIFIILESNCLFTTLFPIGLYVSQGQWPYLEFIMPPARLIDWVGDQFLYGIKKISCATRC